MVSVCVHRQPTVPSKTARWQSSCEEDAPGGSAVGIGVYVGVGVGVGVDIRFGGSDFEHLSVGRIGANDESQSKRQADMQSMSDCPPQGQSQSDLQGRPQAQAGAGLIFLQNEETRLTKSKGV